MVEGSGLEIPCANQQDSAENAGICGKMDAQEALFTPCSDVGDGAEVGTLDQMFGRHYPKHYKEPLFTRHDRPNDLTAPIKTEELLAFMQYGLDAIGLPDELPSVPYGLLGTSRPFTDDFEDPAMRLIRFGADYMAAAIRGERRAMYNIYEKADRLVTEVRNLGAERERALWIEKGATEARASYRSEDIGLVYFIGSEAGPIKIGKANKPETRLKELQTSHFAKLRILVTTRGGQPQEQAYHRQFREHRLHGEWFSPHEDILAEIERLATHPSHTEGAA